MARLETPVRIRWCQTGPDPTFEAPLLALLDEGERESRARFHYARDRWLYLVAHALLRRALSEVAPVAPDAWRFESGEQGRPEVRVPARCDLRFNLSHTRGLAACIVTRSIDCGVDVESIERTTDVRAVAQRMFAAAEVADLETRQELDLHERFARYWTLKEAYVKARGTGLTRSTQTFSFDLDRDEPSVTFAAGPADEPKDWSFGEFAPTPQHRLAWAVEAGGEAVVTDIQEWSVARLSSEAHDAGQRP